MAQGIAMLSITAPIMGQANTIHPVLLWDERDVVLVDTGFPGQWDQLRQEISAYGVEPERLNRIIVTHQDIDHIGNLQVIAESSSTVEVSAHELEKPYIQGDQRLLKFTDEAIASIDRMPEQVPESFRKGLKAIMLNPPRAKVDRLVQGEERLPWCGGITVIDTPGHTPGHISLYHEPSRTLIAGDALVVRDGKLYGSEPGTTLDLTAAQTSIAKLCGREMETVVCYHGGLFRDHVMDRLAELAAVKAQ
nr:MBL fold metallo-hydrolase [Paenibacillus thalictri]